jgi:hypothetical protein
VEPTYQSLGSPSSSSLFHFCPPVLPRAIRSAGAMCLPHAPRRRLPHAQSASPTPFAKPCAVGRAAPLLRILAPSSSICPAAPAMCRQSVPAPASVPAPPPAPTLAAACLRPPLAPASPLARTSARSPRWPRRASARPAPTSSLAPPPAPRARVSASPNAHELGLAHAPANGIGTEFKWVGWSTRFGGLL